MVNTPSKANEKGERCSFSALNKGDVFETHGVRWYKCSERTARLIENDRVFYFKSGGVVTATGLVYYDKLLSKAR